MQGIWTITYAGVERACASWGLTARPVMRTRDRSPTQFSFRMAGAAPEAGVPFNFYPAMLQAGSTVAQAEAQCRVIIKQYSTSTGPTNWSGLLYTFAGYLASYPGDVDGRGQGVTLVFKDAIWLMQSTTFQQLWTIASTPGNPDYISRCVLFMDINSWVPNQYQSVQWQIQQIIAFAALCGIAIAAGTIDYSGWFLNYYHCRAVSCWDALLKCLEPIPDAKVWIDGSQTPPKLNVRTRANIAALAAPAGTGPGPVTLPYKGTDALGRKHFSSKQFTPRYDLLPPQVVLQYQINNTINGKPSPVWTNDVWPVNVGGVTDGQMPFALVCPIDLTGASTTTETGTLDCEPLQITAAQTGFTLGSAQDHAAKRTWWGSKRGGEHHKLANADGTTNWSVRFQNNLFSLQGIGDATVTDEQGNLVNLALYSNRIVRGTYHAWMKNGATQIVALRVKIRVVVSLAEYDAPGSTPAETDSNGNLVRMAKSEVFTFSATLTNAPAGVTPFVGQQYTALAETPVANLAQNIFTSRAILDYDGSHEIVDPGLPNAKPPTSALTQLIGHWNVLNISGAIGAGAAWANAGMTIAGTEIDLMTNHLQIEVGPSKHLQPQDWSSMLQFFRYRRLYMDSSVRATGHGSANNNVDMALNTPDGNTVPGQAVEQQRSVISPDVTNTGVTNVIQHNATTGQTTLVQSDTATGTTLTSAVISPKYSGSGAPSAGLV